MRLLLVGNFLSATRGTRFYCEDLAEKLQERGHIVLTTSRRARRLSRLIDMIWSIVRFRHRVDAAIIECYSGASFIWAECAVRMTALLRKPAVLVLHGGALPEYHTAHPDRVATVLKLAARVVTPSQYLQEAFRKVRRDILYLPNAVDIARYTYIRRDRVRPRIVWLRAFDKSYQPEMAINALSYLVQEFPDIHLMMIGPDKGDGSLRRCQQLVSRLNLERHVEFVGKIPKTDIPDKLQKADILLNTTRFESFGVAVLEAAACGLPIISTAVGEIPYLWNHGADMLQVSYDDTEAMAGAVRRVLVESGLAATLSQNARKKAEGFRWDSILPKWERLLNDL